MCVPRKVFFISYQADFFVDFEEIFFKKRAEKVTIPIFVILGPILTLSAVFREILKFRESMEMKMSTF